MTNLPQPGRSGDTRLVTGAVPDVARDRSPAEGALSDADFDRVTALIHRETGILITHAKKSMLVSRLSRRLRHHGLASFSDYVALLEGRSGGAERQALVSAVTTNVTSFFREPHHFEALAALAPELIARARAGGRVRLWSAGCSTGQEPYSIAATLMAIAPDIAQLDLRILATDIDPVVIETARAGLYERDLLGERPPGQLLRFLQEGAERNLVSIAGPLRSLIRFEVLNLLEPWPFHGQFDVIFCRNVVIYFDVETRLTLWTRFASRLPQGGTLFIGHSERMDRQLDGLFSPAGVTQYRRTALGLSDPSSRNAEGKAPKCP
ncbi:CheR family methyltransferase [Paracoccus sp. NSM]|uniref:CheR family methyltransferase n=1 Tax=Paracoccus sp. NSM TaxID=3457784 RepID=UPI004035A6F8